MYKRNKFKFLLVELKVPTTYILINEYNVPLKSIKYKVDTTADVDRIRIFAVKKRFKRKGDKPIEIHEGF